MKNLNHIKLFESFVNKELSPEFNKSVDANIHPFETLTKYIKALGFDDIDEYLSDGSKSELVKLIIDYMLNKPEIKNNLLDKGII